MNYVTCQLAAVTIRKHSPNSFISFLMSLRQQLLCPHSLIMGTLRSVSLHDAEINLAITFALGKLDLL